MSFIVCKATDGENVNPEFTQKWKKLKHNHLIRGAYHSYRNNASPTKQAEIYLREIQQSDYRDLPPIVEISDQSIKKNSNIENIQKDLLEYLKYIQKETGLKPIIYTSVSFADKFLVNDEFAIYPLWISDYSRKNKTKPNLPKVWKNKGHTIWQKSSSYNKDSTENDFDIYNGTKEEFLKSLRKKTN